MLTCLSKLKSYKLNCSFPRGLGNNDLCSLVGCFLLIFSSLIKSDKIYAIRHLLPSKVTTSLSISGAEGETRFPAADKGRLSPSLFERTTVADGFKRPARNSSWKRSRSLSVSSVPGLENILNLLTVLPCKNDRLPIHVTLSQKLLRTSCHIIVTKCFCTLFLDRSAFLLYRLSRVRFLYGSFDISKLLKLIKVN